MMYPSAVALRSPSPSGGTKTGGDHHEQAGHDPYSLAWLFTSLLLLREERGPHATGSAWLDIDGGHRLFERPVTAERLKARIRRRRVLIPVRANATELPVWLYVVGDRCTGGCKELTGGIWR
ncbi:MAG: hypothetical protein XE12_0844 [Synergistales bacterium 54_9]|nr:MAG: hypothetical protein XE12_0844 [Synergistales bacterium 54_9]